PLLPPCPTRRSAELARMRAQQLASDGGQRTRGAAAHLARIRLDVGKKLRRRLRREARMGDEHHRGVVEMDHRGKAAEGIHRGLQDRKSTRLNSSHVK